MVYSFASSYPYNSLEQLGNPEKQQFQPKILAIPLLSLNPNTTSPQRNLANLLYRALLTEKRQVGMWHDSIKVSINSHRTMNYRFCTAKDLAEIQKTLTNVSANVYCQRNGISDIMNQLFSSGIFVIPITNCLNSKMRRRTELVNEHEALHQVLKFLRNVFKQIENLLVLLTKLR